MATAPALVLPVVLANPSLPQIDYSALERVPELEPDAYDHWIFDRGDSTSLVGQLNGKLLTPIATAPTYDSNFLTTATGVNGLASDLADATAVTMCAVVKKISRADYTGRVIMGASSGGAFGGSIMYWLSASSGTLRARTRDAANLTVATEASIADDSWVFVALSNGGGEDEDLQTYVLGGRAPVTETVTKAVSAWNIAFGNGYYNTSGYEQGQSGAEFILFEGAKTAAELVGIYARTKVRMARRGLTVL